jgi:hypothetical protein
MPYNLNYFDGRAFITLADGVVDQQASSSLYLIGKDVTSYGTIQNDNFLWLTENFAGTVEPVNKVQGQLWFDKSISVLKPKVYDGAEWRTIGIVTSGVTSATNATLGDFWYETSAGQLFIKNTLSNYSLIGPEAVPGFGTTKFVSTKVIDTADGLHACIVMYADGIILGAVSNDDFDVKSTEAVYLAGIPHVGRGFNFASGASISSDDIYLKADVAEVITARWSFTNSSGIGIGTSTIYSSEAGNLTLQSTNRSVVVNASEFRPGSNLTTLGNSSNKFAKVYTSEINAGSSITSANLVGKFILSSSSKIEPGTDGTISFGASNARFATLFSKGLNSGGTTEEGTITGAWKLGAGSSLDVSGGSFISATSDANTVTAIINVISPKLSAGSPSTNGTFVGQWSFGPGSSLTLPIGTTSYYADIAERYASNVQYESGTVVMFGGTSEVTIANVHSTAAVAGIVTTEPAQILNSDLTDSVAIALVGRVPCKVTGNITRGNLLVVSHIPGVLTTSLFPSPGTIVAKAMENYNSPNVGVIEVMVTRG